MFDLPLHPIAVHFPIALGVILPLLVILTHFGIQRGWFSERTWYLTVVVGAIYFGAAVVAAQLGEHDHEIVEDVITHSVMEAHEEAGDKIPWVAGITFLVLLAPIFLKQKVKLRWLAIAVSILGVFPLIQAGHTGGGLVYKEGAASAHVNATGSLAVDPDLEMDLDGDDEPSGAQDGSDRNEEAGEHEQGQ